MTQKIKIEIHSEFESLEELSMALTHIADMIEDGYDGHWQPSWVIITREEKDDENK